jgi:hypothetical protein
MGREAKRPSGEERRVFRQLLTPLSGSLPLSFIVAALPVLGGGVAEARTFPIPAQQPVATIAVPDDWRTVPTPDGVEGSAENGTVRLAVQFIPIPDLGVASEMAATRLAESGVVPVPETRRQAERRYNGLDAVKIDYSGTDPNGESDITLIMVAAPGKSGFVAICYWGDGEAQESLGNDLLSIAESLELVK